MNLREREEYNIVDIKNTLKYIIPICYNLSGMCYIYIYRYMDVNSEIRRLIRDNTLKTIPILILLIVLILHCIFYFSLCNRQNILMQQSNMLIRSTNKRRNNYPLALCNYIINLRNTIVNVTFDCI